MDRGNCLIFAGSPESQQRHSFGFAATYFLLNKFATVRAKQRDIISDSATHCTTGIPL
jgi:hypothetical protein